MDWKEHGVALAMFICDQCHRNGDFHEFLTWWMTRRTGTLLEGGTAPEPPLPYQNEAIGIVCAYLKAKRGDAKKAG